jgi:hypothetical protein
MLILKMHSSCRQLFIDNTTFAAGLRSVIYLRQISSCIFSAEDLNLYIRGLHEIIFISAVDPDLHIWELHEIIRRYHEIIFFSARVVSTNLQY